MPLEAPKLDTRTFEDLVREARLRIPRYTPEWTDFNDSDPGMTLVQLFAWLSEGMLYQLNRVPERNYIKFLQLLGMELRPAQPATAYLTFTPLRGAAHGVKVPGGAPIAARPPEGGPPIVFETEEGLDLVPVPLVDVQVWDGSSFTLVSAANQPQAPPFRPLGWVPQLGSALYLGFAETAFAPPPSRRFPEKMRLRSWCPETGGEQVKIAPPPRVNLIWEYRSLAAPGHWRRLELYRDDTAAFTREGDILLRGPADAAPTAEGKLGEGDERYWLRCRLTEGGYEAGCEPEIDFLRPNTVAAMHLTTLGDEVVGTSDGHPDQTFELARRPVHRGSLELWSEQAGLPDERWERVDDLLGAAARDRCFTLNATAGRLRFGDGRHGRIPPAGADLVARRYRYGGGAAGNVAAGEIAAPLVTLDGVEAVRNERPAAGGRDEQSVEELKELAPLRLRHRERAVTAEDYAALAREVGGVAAATALPLAHPDFPDAEVPGAVTVVIVPESRAVPPQPTPELLQRTSRRLEELRVLTTELHVRGPRYLALSVHTEVIAGPYQAFDTVAEAVHRALGAYLDPLDQPFGRDIFPSHVAEVILAALGVEAIRDLAIHVDGRRHPGMEQTIVLPADGLAYGIDHSVKVSPLEDR